MRELMLPSNDVPRDFVCWILAIDRVLKYLPSSVSFVLAEMVAAALFSFFISH